MTRHHLRADAILGQFCHVSDNIFMFPLPNATPPHAWLGRNPVRAWLGSQLRKFTETKFRQFPADWIIEAQMPYQGPQLVVGKAETRTQAIWTCGQHCIFTLLVRSNFLIRDTILHLFTFHLGSILYYSQFFLSDWPGRCLFSDCF